MNEQVVKALSRLKETIAEIENLDNSYWNVSLEKAREFDPFGHAGFDPTGIIRLTP